MKSRVMKGRRAMERLPLVPKDAGNRTTGTYTHTRTHTHTHTHTQTHTHTHTHTHMYEYINMCIYIHIIECMYVAERENLAERVL